MLERDFGRMRLQPHHRRPCREPFERLRIVGGCA